jgi:hypothetical protein
MYNGELCTMAEIVSLETQIMQLGLLHLEVSETHSAPDGRELRLEI